MTQLQDDDTWMDENLRPSGISGLRNNHIQSRLNWNCISWQPLKEMMQSDSKAIVNKKLKDISNS